jgi:hypothetical protein
VFRRTFLSVETENVMIMIFFEVENAKHYGNLNPKS